MMSLVCLSVLTFVASCMGATEPHSRGCIYILGRCSSPCPVNTRAYTTGCGYLTPEATCSNPHPVEDKNGKICDYSACYCEPPLVRDQNTKTCVQVKDCSPDQPKNERF